MNHPIKLKWLLWSLLIAVLTVAIVLTVYFVGPETYRGAVAANGAECGEIGKKILEQGGSAVDAAIATLICDGITCPQSLGLGGGFFMVVYTKRNRRVSIINARETAPAAANQNMFVEHPESSHTGGLAIAVPGELKGYWEAHREYGQLPWAKLFEPSIELCKNGHKVSTYLAANLKSHETIIKNEKTLRDVFIDPATGETWKAGDTLKRPALAKSLEAMAVEGANALYSKNGTLFDGFMNDLRSFGSIITEEDMLNYRVQWTEPVVNQLDEDHQLFSMPLPGSGILLSFILNLVTGYDKVDGSILSIHRMIEAFKFAYAERGYLGDRYFVPGIEQRISNLSSESFADYIRTKINDERTFEDYKYYGANFSVTEDHGTAHISVLTPDGDAVAVTSTINLILGCKRVSPTTGIILNDEMDDFSTPGKDNEFGVPPSPSNYIVPGKRPMSSMSPTIIVDKSGQPVMVLGAAGGTKITTSTATTILNYMFKGQTIAEAIAAPRIHHQLAPMYVEYESTHAPSIMTLQNFRHTMKQMSMEAGFASVIGISQKDGEVRASVDPRRGGSIGYLK